MENEEQYTIQQVKASLRNFGYDFTNIKPEFYLKYGDYDSLFGFLVYHYGNNYNEDPKSGGSFLILEIEGYGHLNNENENKLYESLKDKDGELDFSKCLENKEAIKNISVSVAVHGQIYWDKMRHLYFGHDINEDDLHGNFGYFYYPDPEFIKVCMDIIIKLEKEYSHYGEEGY